MAYELGEALSFTKWKIVQRSIINVKSPPMLGESLPYSLFFIKNHKL